MKNILAILTLLVLAGCQASDHEIYADIAGKAQQDLNFAGLCYTVNHGNISFTGRCPSEKGLAEVKQKVKSIKVINVAYYHVVIAPVTLDTLTPLKLMADSILAQYPQVMAAIGPTGIILKGSIDMKEKSKLMNTLAISRIEPVKDSLTIR
jgi:hypothetical protein